MSVQGTVADRLGDHASAMQFYRDALKISPGEPAVLTNMGLSLALAKQLPEAEQALRQAVASPKADARMRGDLALVLALEGKFGEAERVGLTDLSPEAARANVEAIRQMIAQNDSWRELRKPEKSAKPKAPAAGRRLRRRVNRRGLRGLEVGSMSTLGPGPGSEGSEAPDWSRRAAAAARPRRGPRRVRARHSASGGGVRRAQMRDVERLVDIRRGRQAVGPRGSRRKVRRGRWLADAAGTGIGRAVIGQIQMDMVVVEYVRAWREHGREIPAGARVRLMQEDAPSWPSVFFQSCTKSIARPSASVKPATSTALPKACSESRAPAILSTERQL